MLMRKRSTSNRKALLNMALIKPESYFFTFVTTAFNSESHHSLTSPTFPLDFKPLLLNFFTSSSPSKPSSSSSSSSNQVQHQNHKTWEDYSNKVGLSIIHSLQDNDDDCANQQHSMVLQSRRIIRDSSHLQSSKTSSSSSLPDNSINVLQLSEIQLSEDYTCVTRKNGPNPKVTHIFNDCILQFSQNHTLPNDFLSFCYTCQKKLEGEDIYMYRGEKAFCSCECRSEEIYIEEEKEALEINGNNSPQNSDNKLSDI
ncbi:FCS-Like Zinc finger 10-like [Impatiens glandulifera]|uniref:FCS-Like Zinc finger 10-like n=1 Tax=Impatiens glandulifera TaxID=253017 RepID=UPI001FB13B34|nr:FCS-Like Zinc finger 10-like [Impatiens glandulifera]